MELKKRSKVKKKPGFRGGAIPVAATQSCVLWSFATVPIEDPNLLRGGLETRSVELRGGPDSRRHNRSHLLR